MVMSTGRAFGKRDALNQIGMIVAEGVKMTRDGKTVPAWAVPLQGRPLTAGVIADQCRDIMRAFRAGSPRWHGWEFVRAAR